MLSFKLIIIIVAAALILSIFSFVRKNLTTKRIVTFLIIITIVSFVYDSTASITTESVKNILEKSKEKSKEIISEKFSSANENLKEKTRNIVDGYAGDIAGVKTIDKLGGVVNKKSSDNHSKNNKKSNIFESIVEKINEYERRLTNSNGEVKRIEELRKRIESLKDQINSLRTELQELEAELQQQEIESESAD